MVFSSTIFLTAFLPIVLVAYALMSERGRVAWLVMASLFFYAWGEPKAVLCMIIMIAVNYFIAKLMPPLMQTLVHQHQNTSPLHS